jgi:AcrR family transcriptional regulator
VAKKKDPADRVLDAALELAAEKGWTGLALAEVAARAGVDLVQLHRLYPGKPRLLDALLARIDAAVLAGGSGEETDERPRDRLFDVLMRRFDALQPHRAGFIAILRDLQRDPLVALAGAPKLIGSMEWMLEAAGLGGSGLRTALRARALALLYLAVLRVWAEDDSPDLGRTMAALDARLRQAEEWAGTLRRPLSWRRRPA